MSLSRDFDIVNEEHSESDFLLKDNNSMDNNLYNEYLLTKIYNESNQSTNSSYNFEMNNSFNIGQKNENSSSLEKFQKIFAISNEDNATIDKTPDLTSLLIRDKGTDERKRETNTKTDYTNNKKKKCGRKTDGNTKADSVHDKFKPDNIIRKIKVHVIQGAIISFINNCLKSKKSGKKKLLKLIQNDLTSLKKNKNIELMNTTLKDIYGKNKIGDKYLENKGKYNEKLINEIYQNDEYIELQKFLNLTFMEFYYIYTHKMTKKVLDENLRQKMNNISLFNSTNFQGIEVYIDKLAKKNKEKGMSDDENDEYIKTFKYYCAKYKEWFEEKVGRNEKE